MLSLGISLAKVVRMGAAKTASDRQIDRQTLRRYIYICIYCRAKTDAKTIDDNAYYSVCT